MKQYVIGRIQFQPFKPSHPGHPDLRMLALYPQERQILLNAQSRKTKLKFEVDGDRYILWPSALPYLTSRVFLGKMDVLVEQDSVLEGWQIDVSRHGVLELCTNEFGD